MKSILFSLLMAVALLGCSSSMREVKDEPLPSSGFVIKRGTNLSHWLSQNSQRGEERRKHIQEDDFARLDSLGFDHVRIPVDEEQLWDENGNKHPEAWKLLTDALHFAAKHRLRAIVDLHIIRSHHFNAEHDGTANILFTSEEAQAKLIDMWKQLSASLSKFSTDSVAYEFLNEPVAKDPEQWNRLIAKVHHVLRGLEPNRTLVIGSNMWQGVETFKDLKVPAGDKNIILSCHYYSPMIVTHYKASWNNVGVYSGPINYPGVLISPDNFETINPDFRTYFGENNMKWDRNLMRKNIKQAVDVANRLGLPLFCGEWGVYETCNREVAYAWLRDAIAVFDEFNMSWASWCYDEGFGFWDQKRHQFNDKPMVRILTSGKGLK